MSTHLVIGLGEIGSSVQRVLDCDGIGKDDIAPKEQYDFVHICIPYSVEFVDIVRDYAGEFQASYVVNHSTVPVGTTEKIENAVHSPVRGVHPTLDTSITTFTKYVGGKLAGKVAEELEEYGIPTKVIDNPRETEAGKLWSTTIYGWNIIIEKAIHKYCEDYGLDFATVYNHFNSTYNTGYEKMNMPQFKKYNLEHKPGRIGGHCIESNTQMLDDQIAEDLKQYIVAYQN